MNYYNEHDKNAAQWLRNLIALGYIADGEVDERSIEDVTPSDLAGFTQCHFFAGIGVWSHALRRAGWSDDRAVWTGSCPCQPFSAAGKGAGVADERHLWPAWEWLIARAKPRSVPVFGEQVASKDGLAWFDLVHADLEGQGHTVRAADLCAAGVGAPHIRQRLFFVADAGRAGDERRGGPGEAHGAARTDEGEAQQRQRSGAHVGDSVATRVLADDEAGRRGEIVADTTQLGRGKRRRSASKSSGQRNGPCDASLVGDADDAGSQGRGVPGTTAGGDGADQLAARAPSSSGGSLEHAAGIGREVALQHCAGSDASEAERQADVHRSGSPTNGYWRNADWLPCIDGKARPVEPGTFPLAHGVAGRVGRLRAYGNAIVAPLAEEFIRAYMI